MTTKGWIGVDLDCTLAQYDGWINEHRIGAPIPKMVARVKKMLADGLDVRIFTARVDDGNPSIPIDDDPAGGKRYRDVEAIKRSIEAWCLEHIGKILPITNKKDYELIEFWDDRAIQVEPNTGRRMDGAED